MLELLYVLDEIRQSLVKTVKSHSANCIHFSYIRSSWVFILPILNALCFQIWPEEYECPKDFKSLALCHVVIRGLCYDSGQPVSGLFRSP